ncbi:cell division protein [Streptococcus bovimastitidis]|uniref:Cell division protein DivIB n=1 Tax=Streptococcus bovimastitidis TaxID=1856638 RepID=A0A1L8MMP7_9STRE|nr:cell division protein FtsQ/DivIB [Streptococcus bovimastitidis]OJF72050.1 cell division protein [Streptococcus bovimastitidis]
MAKKKKNSPDKEPVVLTEWQKRNIEFLEKKKIQAEEEKKLKEKLMIEKKAQLQPVEPTEEVEETKVSKILFKKEKKEKQPKEKREKTKRQKALIKALPVLLVSLLIMGTSIFFLTPYSKMKTFDSKGNSHSSLVELVNQSKIKPSEYFLSVLFSRQKHIDAIKASNPWVKDLSIQYELPNHFIFKVKEYRIIAYAEEKNGFQPILENGRRVTVVNKSQLPKNFLIINLKNESDIQYLVRTLAKLPTKLVKNVKSVSLANSKSTPDLLSIQMQDGNTIRVPQSQLLKKMPYYLKLKKNLKDTAIVDMEVGIYSTTSDIEAAEAKVKEEQASKTAKKKETTNSSSSTPSTDTTQSSETQLDPNQQAGQVDPNQQQSQTESSSQAADQVPAQ